MSSRKPVEFQGWPESLPVAYGPYRAIVRHHVDGDTLDTLIDFGFNEYRYAVIRLADCDAPEKNRAATKTAGLASLQHLQTVAPVGTRVRLDTAPDPDSFGRYIASVTLEDGADLATVMVEAGHAAWRSY